MATRGFDVINFFQYGNFDKEPSSNIHARFHQLLKRVKKEMLFEGQRNDGRWVVTTGYLEDMLR